MEASMRRQPASVRLFSGRIMLTLCPTNTVVWLGVWGGVLLIPDSDNMKPTEVHFVPDTFMYICVRRHKRHERGLRWKTEIKTKTGHVLVKHRRKPFTKR